MSDTTNSTSPGHLTPPVSPRLQRFNLNEDEDEHDLERALVPRAPQKPLPPPLCEDEAESLAKEFLPGKTTPILDDIPSRGDVDQQPVLLEVHEHNPERRFVIIANEDGTSTETTEPIPQKQKSDAPRDEPVSSKPTKRQDPDDYLPTDRPALNRRKSRQDLPPIDTEFAADRAPRHHRTRSAVGPRPEVPTHSSTRPRDDMLSPEYTKHSSSGREREKTYHGYSSSTSASGRPSNRRDYARDDRRREGRTSPSPAAGIRSESNAESRRSRRRMSVDRTSEPYHREDSYPIRTATRDSTTSYKRSDDDATPVPPVTRREPIKKREGSRSSDESVASSKTGGRRRRNSTLVHQDSERPQGLDKEPSGWDRSRSRGPPPVPPHGVPIGTSADNFPTNPRSSVTFPLAGSTAPSKNLPYPDDDPFRDPSSMANVATSSATHASAAPSASMPLFPPPIVEGRGNGNVSSANGATPTSTWQVPSFDPVRDALPVDVDVGSYRRYSEGRAGNSVPRFPDCRRKVPVAGKMDWLTLPRSDFNICPDCYQGVFAGSKFRTLFQPMLRPTDKPLACDFGATPWYRIAWLLTLKNERPDMQLFHQVDNVMNNSRNQPCPGTRSATRKWLTIKDPYKRRVVPNFSVCYQCAKTVEVLLPSLTGVFVPLDPRSEPSDSVCALHFTPQRKRFAMYFDMLETTADRALKVNGPPNGSDLAARLERLSIVDECREDSPVRHRYWHTMQFLPHFTVCEECFNEVVRPSIKEESVLARNFYREPQRLKEAACQLYSARMREVFRKACRRNDPKYLEDKLNERRKVEADIHSQLMKLDMMDKKGQADSRTVEEQVAKLIRDWKEWE